MESLLLVLLALSAKKIGLQLTRPSHFAPSFPYPVIEHEILERV